jgi:outer membrane protein assembly factor BamB
MRTIWPESYCGNAIWESSTWALTICPNTSGARPVRRSFMATRSSCSATSRRDRSWKLSTARPASTVWKSERDELPSWGTPSVYQGSARTELVTNGSNFVRGYDPATGKELWRLGGSSKITAPTPVFADGLIVVASGRRPEAPIFAIRAGAAGDITGDTRWVAWQKQQRGPYMPTPLIYGGYLYVLGNAGVFDCYNVATGAEIYRERIPHQGSGFSGSPVAADGKIYLPSEDGDIFVVKAGPHFELLQKNEWASL